MPVTNPKRSQAGAEEGTGKGVSNKRQKLPSAALKTFLGRHVRVFWPQKGDWFAGVVAEVRTPKHSKKVLIRYQVGGEDWGDIIQNGAVFQRGAELCELQWLDAAHAGQASATSTAMKAEVQSTVAVLEDAAPEGELKQGMADNSEPQMEAENGAAGRLVLQAANAGGQMAAGDGIDRDEDVPVSARPLPQSEMAADRAVADNYSGRSLRCGAGQKPHRETGEGLRVDEGNSTQKASDSAGEGVAAEAVGGTGTLLGGDAKKGTHRRTGCAHSPRGTATSLTHLGTESTKARGLVVEAGGIIAAQTATPIPRLSESSDGEGSPLSRDLQTGVTKVRPDVEPVSSKVALGAGLAGAVQAKKSRHAGERASVAAPSDHRAAAGSSKVVARKSELPGKEKRRRKERPAVGTSMLTPTERPADHEARVSKSGGADRKAERARKDKRDRKDRHTRGEGVASETKSGRVKSTLVAEAPRSRAKEVSRKEKKRSRKEESGRADKGRRVRDKSAVESSRSGVASTSEASRKEKRSHKESPAVRVSKDKTPTKAPVSSQVVPVKAEAPASSKVVAVAAEAQVSSSPGAALKAWILHKKELKKSQPDGSASIVCAESAQQQASVPSSSERKSTDTIAISARPARKTDGAEVSQAVAPVDLVEQLVTVGSSEVVASAKRGQMGGAGGTGDSATGAAVSAAAGAGNKRTVVAGTSTTRIGRSASAHVVSISHDAPSGADGDEPIDFDPDEVEERCVHLGSMLEVMTRTKDSIGNTSRYILFGARVGGAARLVEVVVRRLEGESGLDRRIDFFYLLDSVVQCSTRQGKTQSAAVDLEELDPLLADDNEPKTGFSSAAGRCFPSAVGSAVERIVSAIAKDSTQSALKVDKVLRLWRKRSAMPEEYILRGLDYLKLVTQQQQQRQIEGNTSSSGIGKGAQRRGKQVAAHGRRQGPLVDRSVNLRQAAKELQSENKSRRSARTGCVATAQRMGVNEYGNMVHVMALLLARHGTTMATPSSILEVLHQESKRKAPSVASAVVGSEDDWFLCGSVDDQPYEPDNMLDMEATLNGSGGVGGGGWGDDGGDSSSWGCGDALGHQAPPSPGLTSRYRAQSPQPQAPMRPLFPSTLPTPPLPGGNTTASEPKGVAPGPVEPAPALPFSVQPPLPAAPPPPEDSPPPPLPDEPAPPEPSFPPEPPAPPPPPPEPTPQPVPATGWQPPPHSHPSYSHPLHPPPSHAHTHNPAQPSIHPHVQQYQSVALEMPPPPTAPAQSAAAASHHPQPGLMITPQPHPRPQHHTPIVWRPPQSALYTPSSAPSPHQPPPYHYRPGVSPPAMQSYPQVPPNYSPTTPTVHPPPPQQQQLQHIPHYTYPTPQAPPQGMPPHAYLHGRPHG